MRGWYLPEKAEKAEKGVPQDRFFANGSKPSCCLKLCLLFANVARAVEALAHRSQF